MRVLVSAVLLFLQIQPLAGLTLCHVLAAGDPDRMEAECPMSVSQHSAAWLGAPASQNESPAQGHPTISSPASGHECQLAESCLSSTPAVLPDRVILVVLPPPVQPVRLGFAGTIGNEPQAPPVPPPNG